MKESVTYQGILEEGRLESAHKFVLRAARKRFGAPDERTEMAILAITDLERLGRMNDQVPDVKSWQELLAVE